MAKDLNSEAQALRKAFVSISAIKRRHRREIEEVAANVSRLHSRVLNGLKVSGKTEVRAGSGWYRLSREGDSIYFTSTKQ